VQAAASLGRLVGDIGGGLSRVGDTGGKLVGEAQRDDTGGGGFFAHARGTAASTALGLTSHSASSHSSQPATHPQYTTTLSHLSDPVPLPSGKDTRLLPLLSHILPCYHSSCFQARRPRTTRTRLLDPASLIPDAMSLPSSPAQARTPRSTRTRLPRRRSSSESDPPSSAPQSESHS